MQQDLSLPLYRNSQFIILITNELSHLGIFGIWSRLAVTAMFACSGLLWYESLFKLAEFIMLGFKSICHWVILMLQCFNFSRHNYKTISTKTLLAQSASPLTHIACVQVPLIWLPVTRTLANSNPMLTQTKIYFSWIFVYAFLSFYHQLK